MAQRYTWGHALTAIGLVGALAACSNSLSTTKSASAAVDPSKVGLAIRAQAALVANDLATALALGEAAVEHRPNDPSFRALLGNIYLASGRYASAERSYGDALSLSARDPQVVLKYALVQLAQGKSDQALALLGEAQSLLEPADLGLALALAGRAGDAVAILEPAARARGADARTRQNLAFAHALAGDWQAARIVAAQDLPADQVEARMTEWLAMARPGQSSAQVAAFIGVAPIANDPGQPTRLALVTGTNEVRQASVEAPQPVPAAPAPALAEAPAPEPQVEYAALAPEPAPVVEMPMPIARKIAAQAPRPALSPTAVRLTQSLPELRRNASLRPGAGSSRAVLQLGAFNSRASIAGAWSKAVGRHAALRNYAPVTARFDGPKGTVYRLAVKGFASDREATALCGQLKRAGASCFVRAAYKDMPVQLASRHG